MPTIPFFALYAGRIPPQLGKFSALAVLNLKGNKLSGESRGSNIELCRFDFFWYKLLDI